MHAKHADKNGLNELSGERIGMQLCLLLNFGRLHLEIKRVVNRL